MYAIANRIGQGYGQDTARAVAEFQASRSEKEWNYEALRKTLAWARKQRIPVRYVSELEAQYQAILFN